MIPPHTKAVIMSLTQSQLIFMTPDKRHREAQRPNILLELPVARYVH